MLVIPTEMETVTAPQAELLELFTTPWEGGWVEQGTIEKIAAHYNKPAEWIYAKAEKLLGLGYAGYLAAAVYHKEMTGTWRSPKAYRQDCPT